MSVLEVDLSNTASHLTCYKGLPCVCVEYVRVEVCVCEGGECVCGVCVRVESVCV